MHDALHQRLIRKIESLPDQQIYQVLDFIEFLELKYAEVDSVEASGLQKFAENLEDKLRKKARILELLKQKMGLVCSLLYPSRSPCH